MSDLRRLDGERVFCHQCSNEWDRARGGLQCPRCEGEFTEIVTGGRRPNDEESSQPRQPAPNPFHPFDDRPPTDRTHTPFDDHNPWADAPDPEEGDISTYEFQTPGGGRGTFSITSRTYTTGRPNARGQAQSPFGAMGGFGPFGGAMGGFPPFGGNTSGPTQARGQQPASMQDLFSTIFSSMQQAQMDHRTHATGGTFVMGGGAARPANPFDLLTAILNPGGATGRAGDAVWSQEAFDRILEQLAEQGNNAPPPASEDAIRSLPKKPISKDEIGDDGTAECSICMDNVEIGTEVTTLPCGHWFHEDCVVAWLKEHDTCPHCRKPISQGTSNSVPSGSRRRPSRRSSSVASPFTRDNPWTVPDSPSRIREARNRYYDNRTNPDTERRRNSIRRSSSPGLSREPEQYYGGRHESTEYYSGRPEPSRQDSSGRRPSRPESQRSSGGGGVTGWIRDHLPGGGNR